MTNIWGFLLQTLSASLVAALLLVVKRLLRDKLSPRWQYGVWGVLALRLVLPVWTTGKYILLPLPLWLETVKSVAESRLDSVYSLVYAPTRVRFPIPWLSGNPESVTDWIFVLYAVGVLAVLLGYTVSYGKLRLLIRHGSPVSKETERRIDTVCVQYGLQPCHSVTVAGLSSAFVCGILHPVLAIPAGAEVDDKVLLHELLHLKYLDAAQSVVWIIFRALHWCNPFLWYVFNRTGNDMEQLCDQRVLERLEGEQRREYGGILLSMANEKYPRAPGTTSLSNGGANIARRIESIARFKKYPRGMMLVSVCIAVVLLFASLFGTKVQGVEVGGGGWEDDWGFARAMASSRLARCTTVAGALDTYAKGLMYANGVYIAAASPLSSHEALAEEMTYNAKQDDWVYYHLQIGPENLNQNGYAIYNLKELPDGGYEALLVFTADRLLAEDGEGYRLDENGDPYMGVIAYPVRVRYEDAWVVTESGERQVIPTASRADAQLFFQYGSSLLLSLAEYTATGESGTVTVELQTIYTVDNTISSDGSFNFFGSTSFDETVKSDAQFDFCAMSSESTYVFYGNAEERDDLTSAGLHIVQMEDTNDIPAFQDVAVGSDASGSSTDGSSWVSRTVTDDWDGTVSAGGGSSWSGNIKTGTLDIPSGYAARIFWNGGLKETLILKEVTEDGTAAAG